MNETSNLINQTDTQMRKGMLMYCVLLLCRGKKVYSSDIIKHLRVAELIVVEGTLYPLLSRLLKDNILAYEWQESGQGPPRKYYWLTPIGEHITEQLQQKYHQLHKVVTTLEKDKS